MNIAAAVGECISELQYTQERSTVINQRNQLTRFVAWCIARGLEDTEDLTVDHFREYLLGRSEVVARTSVRTLSSHLKRLAKFLNLQEYSTIKLSRWLPHPKVKPDDFNRVHLSAAEVKRLLDLATKRYEAQAPRLQRMRHCRINAKGLRELRDVVLLSIQYGVGTRISETANLMLKDIDFEGCTIQVWQSKTGRPRTVGVSPSVLHVLDLYIKTRKRLGIDRPELFPSPHGGRMTAGTLACRVAAMGKACGLHATTHAGRRFVLTSLARTGNLFEAQTQAGHSQVTTTRLYVPERVEPLVTAMREHDPLQGILGF